jgi:hypothetical protein
MTLVILVTNQMILAAIEILSEQAFTQKKQIEVWSILNTVSTDPSLMITFKERMHVPASDGILLSFLILSI